MVSSSHGMERGRMISSNDFKFGTLLGGGNFSAVYLAKGVSCDTEFAVKVVEKQQDQQNYVREMAVMEKEVLQRLDNVFLIHCYASFQDKARVYHAMEYAHGGELSSYLKRMNSFDVECTRFYAAEIFAALSYLHDQNIVHRDLKPDNILLTQRMHIKLIDFGTAVLLDEPKIKAIRFTGTPEYASPELMSPFAQDRFEDYRSSDAFERYNQVVSAYLMDYWSLGCLIFEFLTGKTPFVGDSRSQYDMYEKVRNQDYQFPKGFYYPAKKLVKELLILSPLSRLGSPLRGGPSAVRTHHFFADVDWSSLPDQIPPLTLDLSLIPEDNTDWEELPAGFEEGQRYALSRQGARTSRLQLLELQQKNPFSKLVHDQLILKQGPLVKRRSLWGKRYTFLLTEGPHLYYVDTKKMKLKGELVWPSKMLLEMKHSRKFNIQLERKKLRFIAPMGDAKSWVEQICAVSKWYFGNTSSMVKVLTPTSS